METPNLKKLPEFLRNPDPRIYLRDNYVVLDFETTNKDKGDALNPDNRLLLAVWVVVKDGKIRGRWSRKDETKQKDLIEDIQAADFVVAHNAKFDLQWLKRCGLDLHDVLVWDTQIAEYVILGNRKARLDLSSCCKRYNIPQKSSLVSTAINLGICPSRVPARWLIEYCKKDVEITWRLFAAQLEELADSRLLPVVFTRCILTPVLAEIEGNGATLDKERVAEEYIKAERELSDIDKELEETAKGINLNSPHQLAKFLYEDCRFKEAKRFGKPDRNKPNKQFPDGMPKTDVHTIKKLEARTKKQKKVQELLLRRSKVDARLSKNLEFFKAVCERYGSKFYSIFNQTVTKTHRLSSTGRKVVVDDKGTTKSCHFQNFPRDLKHVFRAREENRYIGEADGSTLEFRGAGHLGRDEKIREDVINDEDIHSVTANTLTKAGEKTSRQDAKASTFKPLYGGQFGSPAVMAYCEFFREKYKGIADTQRRWADQALRDKQVETEWGLVFYFPYCKMRSNGSITDFTNICNFPVQSFSTAEIIPIALTYFWHVSRDYDIIVTNTVHDSIISDIHESELETYYELSAYAMLDCVDFYLKQVYYIDLFVPLGCGIKVGTHWNEPMEVSAPDSICGYEVKYDGKEIRLDEHRKAS